ncbi:hypothetical protein [Desulfobacter latus]|uniref:Uncharacterized protein n=1 Tax=Desulfobacter latus TaxID=2292 RepID=A0A850T151_9BACT|nr:hypothetical protein [Desulfobacter latus]NWH04821.1 hypothetical protein [Desulfobacter latus]
MKTNTEAKMIEKKFGQDAGSGKDFIRHAAGMEKQFLEGARASLFAMASPLAKDLVNVKKVIPEEAGADSQRFMVEEALCVQGADSDLKTLMPVNSEQCFDLVKKGWFGKKNVLRVIFKSFAATRVLEKMGANDVVLDVKTVNRHLQRLAMQAKDTPCAFLVFSPDPWPASILDAVSVKQMKSLVFCRPSDNTAGELMFSASGADISWPVWCALSADAFEKRVQYYYHQLLRHKCDNDPETVLPPEQLMQILGVPQKILLPLLAQICLLDTHLEITKDKGIAIKVNDKDAFCWKKLKAQFFEAYNQNPDTDVLINVNRESDCYSRDLLDRISADRFRGDMKYIEKEGRVIALRLENANQWVEDSIR